jgi:hypothetical protein
MTKTTMATTGEMPISSINTFPNSTYHRTIEERDRGQVQPPSTIRAVLKHNTTIAMTSTTTTMTMTMTTSSMTNNTTIITQQRCTNSALRKINNHFASRLCREGK